MMDRRTFVARSLPAMLLALLGLRLPKWPSLSAHCLPTARFPRWGTRIQPSRPLTEAMLRKAYLAVLKEPIWPFWP
ncbi:hypothetical protein LCGC14_2082480 [marine sediment metagenome]|uniref:Uncharacterized protein n=1 Tax=marine sediment metagenome TaxID=412755 RepID=A0A0F9EF15_9ZZZZ